MDQSTEIYGTPVSTKYMTMGLGVGEGDVRVEYTRRQMSCRRTVIDSGYRFEDQKRLGIQ